MIKKRKNKEQKKDILVAFDRDGTLIYDDGYFGKKASWRKELKFYDGAIETIKTLNPLADIIVASNQIGVALGFYKPERVEEINVYIDEILQQNRVKIDGWYFSPYVEKKWALENGLDIKSPWVLKIFPHTRKPQIGMLKLAASDLNKTIQSYRKIFVIGDSLDDIQMALKLTNGKGIFFENNKNNHLIKEVKQLIVNNPGKIFIINHLFSAIEIIKRGSK